MFDGGISAALRDLARFGTMILRDGTSLTGQQVVPASWVHDTITGAADSRDAFAAGPVDNGMPGGMYRNQFWIPYPSGAVLLCLGIHGQMIYINRPVRVVAAKLSSWPMPQDAWKLFSTLRAFDAVAAHLQ
jgi:CubicO group peptidase (beta-lactamase class C family)